MFFHLPFLTALLVSWCNAATFTSTPTALGQTAWNIQNAAFQATAAPDLADALGLSRRDSPGNLCGSGTGIGSVTCDSNRSCRGSIISEGSRLRAYQYCSDPALASQNVITTIHANWPSNETCPKSAFCCYNPTPSPITWLYIDSGYTVTGYVCSTTSTDYTVIPATNLLNPSAFSTSLAEAKGITTTSSKTIRSPTSTATHKSSSNAGGMSTGTKIGVGAGVGIGVGAIAVLGAAYWFGRYQRKKTADKTAAALSPTQGPPYDMRGSCGQPPEYSGVGGGVAYKNYHDLNRTGTGFEDVRSPPPQELSGWDRRPQELPGSPTLRR